MSRRAGVAIAAAALLACLLPTIQAVPGQARQEQAQVAPKSKGRIFVSASLRYKPEGKEEEETQLNLIIAIDPATGKWQKITDNGHAGRVSPDGQTLVFDRYENGQSSGIWNCDTQGSNNPGKISDKGSRPIWSPDGKHLVTTKQELLPDEKDKKRTKPAWKDESWKIDADGGNPVKLDIPDTDSIDDWSSDGKWFVTCSDRHAPYGRGYQLYVMKTDGSEQRRLTEGGLNCHARFSPDGKKVAYVRQTAKEGNSIWVVDIDGKNAREIIKEVNLASPDSAFWSPDGKQLAVTMFDWQMGENGRRILRSPNDANFRIEIMNADGSNRRELKLADAKIVHVGALGDWR
jgi:Tol biopolymer transport system component